MSKYTNKTLAEFRAMGRYYDRGERWNPYGNEGRGIREDMFGFIDYIALDPIDGIVAVQICNPSSWTEHKKKSYRTIMLKDGYALAA